MQKTKKFRELPIGAKFRFKNGTEIMEKHDNNTCGFRFTTDGLYPVNPNADVVELERGEYTCFGN